MSFRVPLALLVVALGLLGYIYGFERRGAPSPNELGPRQGFVLDNVLRERVDSIRIGTGPGQIIAKREGEGFDEQWTLEAPERGPANDTTIDNFLGNWDYAAPLRKVQILGSEDLTRFGFDKPKAYLSFAMEATQVELFLGSGTPVDGAGYVRVDDRPEVMVVDEQVVSYFTANPEDWLGKSDAEPPTLDEIEPRREPTTEPDVTEDDAR